ncbi:MAG TPA: hypothetical protein DIC65_05590 [Actinobacteria bacterium]|nr:hypothetical protein [Actinomycetota bacterium]
MLLVSGTSLVLASWAFMIVLILALGAGPAIALAQGAGSGEGALVIARRALWLGLSIFLVAGMFLNLFVPMASPINALVIFGLGALSLVTGWIRIRRNPPRWKPWQIQPTRLTAVIVVTLFVAQAYLALAALGPLTNYDSGLYHLGAVEYSRLFPAIPGLANVYSPLGYSTAEFPLAAALGAGPWGPEGLRLANGLLMAVLALDVALRALQGRRGPGFFVAAVGLVAAWVPLLALSDYWVTSPSQDTAALILCVAAAAYLADAVGRRVAWAADAATACAAAISVSLIRPTLGAFTVGVILVSGVLAVRRGRPWRPTVVVASVTVAVMGVAAVIATLARDIILSGWLLFPLSTFPVPVDWRAPDPTFLRLATLGYHRDPENLWESTEGWNWVASWIQRLPQSWETFEFALLGLTAVLLLMTAHRWTNLRVRGLGITMLPSIMSVAVWFTLAPPSFRFGWGPIVTLAAVPIGWSLWRLSRLESKQAAVSAVVGAGVALPLVGVVVFSAITRLDYASFTDERTWSLGVSIPYAVAPLPEVESDPVATTGGVELLVPSRNEQCWAVFPLCTPTPLPGLTPRGPGTSDGFVVY